jgi:MFS family permease
MNSHGKDILLISMLFLVNSLAIDMISPIWPIFISSLGASMTELGLVFAISNAVGAAMQIPSGLLSDRYGRRQLHLLGTFLTIYSPLAYAFASGWTDLIPWLALSGFATGLYLPIRWAIVADLSASQNMASAYSWTNIAWLGGSTIAPFIGGWTADALGLRFPFFTCFALRFLVLPIALFVRETGRKPGRVADEGRNPRTNTETSHLYTMVWISLINVVQGVGMGITGPIIPIFVITNFQVDYTFIGILYAIGFGVASILAQAPGARFSNRFDRRKIMLVTFVASSPFFLLFYYSRSTLELLLFMFLSNLVLNLHWPAYQTYLMDATPSSKWGFVNGVSATTFWIGVMVGNLVGGILWQFWGVQSAFYASCCAFGLSALPLLPLKRVRAS